MQKLMALSSQTATPVRVHSQTPAAVAVAKPRTVRR